MISKRKTKYQIPRLSINSFLAPCNILFMCANVMLADNQFLKIENVRDKLISVRKAVAAISLSNGQGYLKYSCKPSKTM